MTDIKRLIEHNPFLNRIYSMGIEMNIPMIEDEGIEFISELINQFPAPKVLEIGTAIGYSSIALSVMTKAEIWSVERNQNLHDIALKNVIESSLTSRIHLLFSDAFDLDNHDLGIFDVIFIDAAKAQYQRFFTKFEPLLSENGLIVTDNLSFHGIVNSKSLVLTRNQRALARKIQGFINWLTTNDEFNTTFYDIGDGMSVSRRKRG